MILETSLENTWTRRLQIGGGLKYMKSYLNMQVRKTYKFVLVLISKYPILLLISKKYLFYFIITDVLPTGLIESLIIFYN